MYNGNGFIAGGATTGALLPVTGAGHTWLALAAGGMIMAGFALARIAGRRSSPQTPAVAGTA
jgi:hypothetical protein